MYFPAHEAGISLGRFCLSVILLLVYYFCLILAFMKRVRQIFEYYVKISTVTSFMTNPSQYNILILGVGNILLSDEGAGVRALELLQQRYTLSPFWHPAAEIGDRAGSDGDSTRRAGKYSPIFCRRTLRIGPAHPQETGNETIMH